MNSADSSQSQRLKVSPTTDRPLRYTTAGSVYVALPVCVCANSDAPRSAGKVQKYYGCQQSQTNLGAARRAALERERKLHRLPG